MRTLNPFQARFQSQVIHLVFREDGRRGLELQVSKEGRQGVGFGVGLVADALVDHLLSRLSVGAAARCPSHFTRCGHAHNIHLISLFLPAL